MTELKPCPFCGKEPKIFACNDEGEEITEQMWDDDYGVYEIYDDTGKCVRHHDFPTFESYIDAVGYGWCVCCRCGGQMLGESKHKVIERWNKRVSDRKTESEVNSIGGMYS